MPRVHIVTHAIVESDDDREIYGLVAEHLERVKELSTIESMAIQHGDYAGLHLLAIALAGIRLLTCGMRRRCAV